MTLTSRSIAGLLTTVLIAAGLAATLGLVVVMVPALRSSVTDRLSNQPQPLRVGEVLDVEVPEYQRSEFTAVLFGSSSCGACTRGAPYFRRLVSELEHNVRVQVVFMSVTGLNEAERAYGASVGVEESRVFLAPAGVRQRIRRIPTLFVIDSARRIRFASTGFGSEEEVGEMVTLIGQRLTLW